MSARAIAFALFGLLQMVTTQLSLAFFLGSAVSTILVSLHLVHSNVCTSEPAPFGINLIRVMGSAHLVQRG